MSSVRRPFRKFTPQDDAVWSRLWDRQIDNCRAHACSLWLDGLDKLGLERERVPDFNEVNARLKALVGWELVSTDVIFSDGQDWFEHLARKQFLITEYIRDEKDLLYTPMPDIWHDSFGHLPLMTDQRYADYFQHFAEVALRYTKEERKSLGSLWWYTVEFGFLIERGELKCFGAGLMSSPGEMEHALSATVEKVPFSLDVFEAVKPSPHEMHRTLFILDSIEQLHAAPEMWVAAHPALA